ncbi:MAG: gas vesicle protein [Candidatus Latescibacteria bacterium]|nr:gas vesicle protein [Candidatus Latescibacterota bacterium]
MELREAVDRAKEALRAMVDLEPARVTGVSVSEDGWRVVIEMVERKAIPDTQDILGAYEVRLDNSGHVTGYERKRVRRRMDLEEVVE